VPPPSVHNSNDSGGGHGEDEDGDEGVSTLFSMVVHVDAAAELGSMAMALPIMCDRHHVSCCGVQGMVGCGMWGCGEEAPPCPLCVIASRQYGVRMIVGL